MPSTLKPPALFPLLAFLFLAVPLPAMAQDNGTIEGWGIQRFNGKDDLDKAVEISKEKARLDLSANILTSVNVKTVDKMIQSGGNVQEEFKRITVTKVVQVLREAIAVGNCPMGPLPADVLLVVHREPQVPPVGPDAVGDGAE